MATQKMSCLKGGGRVKRTIPILLPKDADLLATMRLFKDIANEVSKIAFGARNQLKKKFDLRRHCYPILRERYPNVNGRVLEYIIKVVAGCYSKKKRKTLKEPVVFKKDFVLFDKRLFKFNEQTLTIWTVTGRKEFPFTFVPVKRFQEWWERKTDVDSITLKERNGKIVAHVCLTIPMSTHATAKYFVGIDRGAECPLVAVRNDGKIFFPDFSEFHRKRQKWLEQRRYLQQKLAMQRWLDKDAHNTVRALKRLSGKQQRFTRQFIRWVVNRLLTWASDAIIIMEKLRLPQRKKVKGAKALNRTLSLLPYGIVKKVIMEKAQERGLTVLFVNPKGTSKTCPQCGAQGERLKRDSFNCPSCGFSCHADIVGAMNILKRGLELVFANGAEAGDKPAEPFQPHHELTCPVPDKGTGNVGSHYSPQRLQSIPKRKRAIEGRLQPTLF
jgi:IS605 OrfB family transposase